MSQNCKDATITLPIRTLTSVSDTPYLCKKGSHLFESLPTKCDLFNARCTVLQDFASSVVNIHDYFEGSRSYIGSLHRQIFVCTHVLGLRRPRIPNHLTVFKLPTYLSPSS
ncbi:unnamed protein product [Schistosoma bovis]|nr:unnamed protein product [Schistosoma bovis]